ncbi:clathrin heavy chain 2-like [Saccostrea echinata]|uniref:clathrin heavy chain 2-like n=1 Tax=Saccostrea echinata TaxID=191078 RepID=UPI002A8108F8|nr:clathrin heavy chain 2-like [Saccostrea echinata]XP_061196969.1 clathrin heavy chain 2-like [Saccostrea echinata]
MEEEKAESKPPVSTQEILRLSDLEISLEYVTWTRVALTTDKWMAVRHNTKGETSQLTILNPLDGSIKYSEPIKADSVQVNPSQPIIAVKCGQRLEVYNFETNAMISKSRVHEPIAFWTWLNSDIIAMVTESFIYHWDLWQDDNPPVKMFMRHNRLTFSEIISYKADSSLKWLAITGLIPEDEKITGTTQLYSVDEDITQCIGAHVVCFSSYQFSDNLSPSTIFCVGSRDAQDHGKVHVIELGPYKPGNFAPKNSYDHIQFLDDVDRYDFPVSLHVSPENGLLFLITKYGYLYLCDLESSVCLCSTRISTSIIFCSTLNSTTQGILGVTRDGQVISVDVDKDDLVTYVRGRAKTANQADRLEKAITQL